MATVPSAGDRISRNGYEWEWVAPTDALRGFWTSTDGTRVDVLPPSEGIEAWMVVTTDGDDERLIEMSEVMAWPFAAGARRVRARQKNGT